MFSFNKVKRKAEEEKLAEVMAGNAELGLSNSLFCLMAQSTPSMLIPAFSGIYHLVGPSGGKFVGKPLPRGGALMSVLLEAVNIVSFRIFLFKMCLFR